MIINYAVTFEFDTRPPTTHRGTVEGSAAATCARRAIEQAQKALKPIAWTSMVCCFLERLPAADGVEAETAEPESAEAI
jgi:hypothetical protein